MLCANAGTTIRNGFVLQKRRLCARRLPPHGGTAVRAVERAQCALKSGYALLNDGSDGSNGFVLQKSAADFGERLYRLLSNPRLVVLRREPELFDRRCAITSQ